MRLIYHPDAEAELIEAARFYEGRVSTLGAQFLDAADGATIILEAPDRWNIIEQDLRQYLISRFRFAIYYRSLSDHVRILAFMHHSRHSDY
ncbi:MAG: type II toxin-antitoxin system RelE/ParE family toxin [Chthoniobacterales bacterium]